MFEFNLIFIKHKLQQDWRISCLYWKPQISRRAGLRRDKEQHERSVETYYNFRACIGFVMFYDVFSYHTNLVRQDVSLHWENKSPSSLMSTNLDRQHSRDAGVSQRTGQTTYYHTIKISQKADGCVFCIPASVITAPTWRDTITSDSVNVRAAKAGPDYLSKQITWLVHEFTYILHLVNLS